MKMKVTIAGLVVLTLATVFLQTCKKTPSQKTSASQMKKSASQIVRELELQSLRGVEFFNSSFDSVALSGAGAADTLKNMITAPNRQYMLPLLALRKVRPDLYRQIDPRLKTGILVDALNNSIYFNAWGIPHRALEDSTKPRSEAVEAITEIGPVAMPWLGKLLFEKRSAPLWGAEALAQRYRYRVADYAFIFLALIENRQMNFSEERADRDFHINQYIIQLNASQ